MKLGLAIFALLCVVGTAVAGPKATPTPDIMWKTLTPSHYRCEKTERGMEFTCVTNCSTPAPTGGALFLSNNKFYFMALCDNCRCDPTPASGAVK